MMHPKTELKFINNIVGNGVVATDFIPAGTITWALDKLDREFTPGQFQSLSSLHQNILDTYCYRNNKGNFILCWDHGRFVNHSFNSNCLTTAYDFEISIRGIHPGEQLTDDYGYLNILVPFKAADEGTKRKVVYPDDLLKYYKIWDEQISNVFNDIIKQEQPLREIIDLKVWDKIQRIIQGEEKLDSIKLNYFNPKN